ncbi:hypothetical protein HXX76_010600 [Chlamydomonas incerta]|uniref:receptor protein serine/threonine kinase n=1 Tax=Chlamydomonas incerta TaxID=51695 RepID=A0A835T1H0_CHLIN|nr:hypothetical protein HXX76_010600 [Chlamydomonas incerta]|eukprot:KAG2429816.1 hypothetical protein HXX76_010600 [Chlamydomonas incerta]
MSPCRSSRPQQQAAQNTRKRLRGQAWWLVVALVVCCSRPAPADHIPGLPGPYPGLRVATATGLTVDISTEAELIAAISNDTVKVAHLVKNLRLEAKGWPVVPILRNTSFTIAGDPAQFPILDLAFIENKVQLQKDAVFTFKGIEVRNTRQRSGFEVDLFAASPGGYVRYEGSVHHCFSCLPPDIIMGVMTDSQHATVPQNITLAAHPWCRAQPLLAKCYNSSNDLDIFTASAELPVSGLQGVSTGGGYVLEGLNLHFVCDAPASYECGNTKGWDICVRQSIEDVLSRDRTWEILAAAARTSGGDGGDSNTVAVAVGVAVGVGGGLLLLAGGAFLYMRHRRGQQAAQGGPQAAAGKAAGGGYGGGTAQGAPVHELLRKTRAGGMGAADALAIATADSRCPHRHDGSSSSASSGKAAGGGGEARACAAASGGGIYAAGAAGAAAAAAPSAVAFALPPLAVLPPHQPPLMIPAALQSVPVAMCQQQGSGVDTARLRQLYAGAAGGGDSDTIGPKPSSMAMVGGVSLELDVVLGSGSFGKVFRGAWQGQAVAVKVLHYGQELCRAVHTEVLLSQALKHVNIVNSLHFVQVLPGGRLAAISASEVENVDGSPAAAVKTSAMVGAPARPTSVAVAGSTAGASSSRFQNPSDSTAAAGNYSRFLNTHDLANPPSAMLGSSLAAGRAAATAAAVTATTAAAAKGSGAISSNRISSRASSRLLLAGAPAAAAAGASVGGVAAGGLAAAFGCRPVRAMAALSGGGGGGTSSRAVAPLGKTASLRRAASLPLEEFWKLLRSSEPLQPSASSATDGGSGAGASTVKSRTSASGAAGAAVGEPLAAPAAPAAGNDVGVDDEVDCSHRSAPDVLSGWVHLQAMRRALAGDSCSGERLPEEELMALEEGDEEQHACEQQGREQQQQLQQEAAGAHGEGRTTLSVPTASMAMISSTPSSDVVAREVVAEMFKAGRACCAAGCAAGAGAAVGPAGMGAVPTGILTGTPRAGGGEGGGEAQTPRITLPLEQLWLAAHAQPVEGSSHGFLVMELCEGGSLQSWRAGQWRARDDRPDMAVLLPLALDIARGMLYIHSAGVCHGDLKLANIMLARTPPAAGAADGAANSGAGSSRRGSHAPPGSGCAVQVPEPRSLREGWVAKVGDFGLSRLLTTERTHVSTRPAGTISHMAPELWSKGHVSPQADVYAYGITLWELATGDKPYRGLNMARLVHRVLVSGGRPALPLWLPPAYTRLVTSCWAPSPKDRPTFAAIVQYLEMMIAALPARSVP